MSPTSGLLLLHYSAKKSASHPKIYEKIDKDDV